MSVADDRDDRTRFLRVRLQADGRPDRLFGPNGMHLISFGSGFERAQDIALDAEGRTVAVGLTKLQGTDNDSPSHAFGEPASE